MKCPHCLENFHADGHIKESYIDSDLDGNWSVESVLCPSCRRLTLHLVTHLHPEPGGWILRPGPPPMGPRHSVLIRPKVANRSPVPLEVPEEFATDYREACLVLADSPKASAALSRRCLQFILRKKVGVKDANLHTEIEKAKALNIFPSSVVDLLDVPREVGNFAAHPLKASATGSIVDVEPWEAEWCLEVIEALYDHLFVRPAKNAERLQRLSQKASP